MSDVEFSSPSMVAARVSTKINFGASSRTASPKRSVSDMQRAALRRYLRTWSPWYDPAKIEIPDGVQELLTKYSGMVEAK